MIQGVKLQMDPKEWAALIELARKAKPKGEEQEAMSRLLAEKSEIVAKATRIEVKEPF